MVKKLDKPIVITGAGRRIGLALAHHFLAQQHDVIVSYRTRYPAIDVLEEAGAVCIEADFCHDDGILAFAEAVKARTTHIRALLHNASTWQDESPPVPPADVLNAMLQIHVHAPYLLNFALEPLLRGQGHAACDIIHFTDYVVERGSAKYIAYAASKAALDNLTRSFARKLAPEVKVNAIAPSQILFNEHDDPEYRQKALNKSLMKIAPGEKEIIDLVDYLLTSRYVTGHSYPVNGGRPLR
ncbi:dihydromonapterin reductase [Cronobacter turicensis]|jgi:dihydromonapterin reductase/dihydrofolate reductase|uniref:dihydromonapterin reductase n=1 Tax=Cronobacter turicensis TaxID=413502 RepID=UPI000CFCCA22|nr:dihydromonapterin reductase [Cronobacter turicensis]EKM0376919.1 dihydromonapterin reductase [Cronobacter turicensis]EKY3195825.1 dihydromonapterin reductase [Cronobacter turicensis]ELQ6148838.1 dihydromonapterin reductase [Cronobacter turicensis]ELQ6220300.1 dihydromonapterin reductase [Cronobacter turicensis]ELQ6271034.1 dihydromonapterin reductase [Cronobacter turicensis]